MIPQGKMAQLISRFRNICFEKYPEDIYVLLKEERDKILGVDRTENQIELLLDATWDTPLQDICRLAKVPRILKTILRRTYRIWERLHGEIDFDNILIANTLRYCASEAFEFLLANYNEIRGLLFKEDSSRHDERVKAIENKWELASKDVKWDSVSAYKLVCIIFPYLRASYHHMHNNSLQSLHVHEPTDYWTRYLQEELPLGTIRDQEILHGMKEWKHDYNSAQFRDVSLAYALCTNKELAEKFEYLAPVVLTGEDIRKFATITFEQGLLLYGVKANENLVIGFINLWRLGIRNPIDETEHFNWIAEEIYKALSTSLCFAISLFYYWQSNSTDEATYKMPNLKLQDKVCSDLKMLYEKNTTRFIKVLDPTFIYSSYHLLNFIGGIDNNREPFDLSRWEWFPHLLLDAGEIDPQVIMPQLACILVKEEFKIFEFEYIFKEGVADQLFQSEKLRLMNILAKDVNTDKFDQRDIGRIEKAKAFALKWLSENSYNK
jgi:hypothetical protein